MKKSLEILNRNRMRNMDGFVYDHDKSSKEIHKHYIKLTEWIIDRVIKTNEGKYYVGATAAMEDKTLEELYQYWLNLNQ